MDFAEASFGNITGLYNTSTAIATTMRSSPQPTVPWSILVKWSILSVLIPVGVVGNGLTLAAVYTNESLWTKTNRILVSLTIVDMLTVVLVPPVFVYVMYSYLGRNPCGYGDLDDFIQGFAKLMPKISVNHLIVVAIDRYVAIIHPFAYEKYLTDKVVKWMLVAAWLSGSLMAASYWFWMIKINRQGPCTTSIAPNVVSPLFTFLMESGHLFIIACFIAVTYASILRVAWRHHNAISNLAEPTDCVTSSNVGSATTTGDATVIANQSSSHPPTGALKIREKSVRKQVKAFYLTAAIVGLFVVMWTPYSIGRFLQYALSSSPPFVSMIIDVGAALGLVNSSFNWIMYAAFSRSYQRAYRKLFSRIPCLAKNLDLEI